MNRRAGMLERSNSGDIVARNLLGILGVVLIVTPMTASAEWGSIVRLSESDSVSDADLTSLAARGQDVHAVWRDYLGVTWCLVYRRSSDGGENWSTWVALARCIPTTHAICHGAGATIHFAYDSSGVRYRRSTDHGATWSASDSLSPSEDFTPFTFASSPSGYVHVAYYLRDTIFVRRSTNDGASWSTPRQLIRPSYLRWSYSNRLVVDYPPHVYFLCHSSRDTLWMFRSTDTGATWEAPAAVAVGTDIVRDWYVADASARLHLGWSSKHTGVYQTYYRRSTDHGTSWGEVTQLTNSPDCMLSWLDARDGVVYAGYLRGHCFVRRSFDGGATWDEEIRWPFQMGSGLATAGEANWVHALFVATDSCITYLRSKDAGTSWSDTVVISDTSPSARGARAIKLEGGNVHVLWQDHQYGNYEVLYRMGAGMAHIEEHSPPSVPRIARTPAVLTSGVVNVLARAGIVFDVAGRRTFNPQPGVYFVKPNGGLEIRRVVIAR